MRRTNKEADRPGKSEGEMAPRLFFSDSPHVLNRASLSPTVRFYHPLSTGEREREYRPTYQGKTVKIDRQNRASGGQAEIDGVWKLTRGRFPGFDMEMYTNLVCSCTTIQIRPEQSLEHDGVLESSGFPFS